MSIALAVVAFSFLVCAWDSRRNTNRLIGFLFFAALAAAWSFVLK